MILSVGMPVTTTYFAGAPGWNRFMSAALHEIGVITYTENYYVRVDFMHLGDWLYPRASVIPATNLFPVLFP